MPKPRQCFTIFETQFHPERGYIPSLVVEDEAGHTPMIGSGECAQPWYWSTDPVEAKRICDQANARTFGITPAEATEIVISSMAAQNRSEGTAASRRVRLAEVLGRQPDPADIERTRAEAQ